MNSNVPTTVETYTNVAHDDQVDAGWSGTLRIVLGRGLTREQFVYVDSDLLGPRRLVLTPEEAGEVAAALAAAAGALSKPAEATTSGPSQGDVASLRELLDVIAGFTSNHQRARYLLSSNWLRDRGAIAAARLSGLSAVERTLKTEGVPAGRPGPDGA